MVETNTGTESVRNSVYPVPTGRFVALVAATAVVVSFLPVPKPWAFLIANVVLLGLGLIDLLSAPRAGSIVIDRQLPPLMTLDGEATVTWTVHNPCDRRIRVAFDDDLPPSLRADRRGSVVWVPAAGRIVASTAIRPKRRGRFLIETIVIRVDGPMRLMARQGSRSTPGVLRVYPPFRSKREAELRIEKARILEVGLRSVRGRGGGTEFDQLREYGVDDDFRRMDWAATARTGKAIVRTYRAEQNQNVILMLDCGRVMSGLVDGVARIEHGMDAVMTMATVAGRLGDKVGLIAFDKNVRAEVSATSGSLQLGRVTEAMYRLEPQLVESDYRGAFIHAMSRFKRRSMVIILTELAEQGLSDTLLPALPLLQRNHLVVVASVSDPDVDRWARSIPTELSAAYRKSSAVAALDSRQKTVRQLRNRGAVVVDAVPGKLSVQLADAYLDAKAAGRL